MPPETKAQRHFDEFEFAGAVFRVITEESNPPKF
jgi:hypothetical protein